jgi:hypothetical protein
MASEDLYTGLPSAVLSCPLPELQTLDRMLVRGKGWVHDVEPMFPKEDLLRDDVS